MQVGCSFLRLENGIERSLCCHLPLLHGRTVEYLRHYLPTHTAHTHTYNILCMNLNMIERSDGGPSTCAPLWYCLSLRVRMSRKLLKIAHQTANRRNINTMAQAHAHHHRLHWKRGTRSGCRLRIHFNSFQRHRTVFIGFRVVNMYAVNAAHSIQLQTWMQHEWNVWATNGTFHGCIVNSAVAHIECEMHRTTHVNYLFEFTLCGRWRNDDDAWWHCDSMPAGYTAVMSIAALSSMAGATMQSHEPLLRLDKRTKNGYLLHVSSWYFMTITGDIYSAYHLSARPQHTTADSCICIFANCKANGAFDDAFHSHAACTMHTGAQYRWIWKWICPLSITLHRSASPTMRVQHLIRSWSIWRRVFRIICVSHNLIARAIVVGARVPSSMFHSDHRPFIPQSADCAISVKANSKLSVKHSAKWKSHLKSQTK